MNKAKATTAVTHQDLALPVLMESKLPSPHDIPLGNDAVFVAAQLSTVAGSTPSDNTPGSPTPVTRELSGSGRTPLVRF